MNIIVVGGKGFIGSHIVNKLSLKHNITIIDGWSKAYPGFSMIHRGAKGLQPISELEKQHRLIGYSYRQRLISGVKCVNKWTFNNFMNANLESLNPDLIINCGGLCEAILSQYLEEFTRDSTVIGLQNIKRIFECPVIQMSSSMVYGTWEGKITEDHPLNPVDWYGECKRKAEELLDDTKDVILRPMHVYGTGDGSFPITMNIERQFKASRPINIEEADCLYIKDFVVLMEKIVDNLKPGTYNVSSGYNRDKNVIKKYAKSLLKMDVETKSKLGPTGKQRGKLDNTKIKEIFNWKLNYLTYEESIMDYIGEHENLR